MWVQIWVVEMLVCFNIICMECRFVLCFSRCVVKLWCRMCGEIYLIFVVMLQFLRIFQKFCCVMLVLCVLQKMMLCFLCRRLGCIDVVQLLSYFLVFFFIGMMCFLLFLLKVIRKFVLSCSWFSVRLMSLLMCRLLVQSSFIIV